MKIPGITPKKFVDMSSAARNAADAIKRQGPAVNTKNDMVDLAQFNAQTNKVGFFKKIIKTIKILWRENTRID